MSTPRVLAAALLEPQNALRVCRRGGDAGAAQLVRLMVEHGGALVPRSPALEPEAERLRGWFPFSTQDDGWRVPRDFAAAAAAYRERERFFSASLVSRLSAEDANTVFAELGISDLGTRRYRLQRAVAVIAESEPSDSLQEAADATGELQSMRSRDVDSLTYVHGTKGQKYCLRLSDGEEIVVCPRELAEKLGATFAAAAIESTAVAAREQRHMPAVRVPVFQEIGALITFATARAAEEAYKLAEFRAIAARRIDDRRVASRGSVGPDALRVLLRDIGFHVELGSAE